MSENGHGKRNKEHTCSKKSLLPEKINYENYGSETLDILPIKEQPLTKSTKIEEPIKTETPIQQGGGTVRFAEKISTQKMQRHIERTAPVEKSYFSILKMHKLYLIDIILVITD